MPPRDEAATGSVTERTTHTAYARHGLGGRWWLGLVVVPLLLAALVNSTRGDELQDTLGRDAQKALAAKGITGVEVNMQGREADIGTPIWMDPEPARAVVEGVEGVSAVNVASLDAGNPYSFEDCSQPRLALATIVGKGIQVDAAGPFDSATLGRLRSVAQLINTCELLRVEIAGQRSGYLKSVLQGYHIEARRIVARLGGTGNLAVFRAL